jgi:hypothetical protein
VRAALLETLAVGLGPDDRSFLEKLAIDRADSVKQLAQRLLARLPDAEGFAQRVADAAKCFKRTGGGAGRVMAALGIGGERTPTFTLPFEPSKWQEAFAERERLFSGLPLAALATAVGVTPDEIIAALPAHEAHLRALLLSDAQTGGDSAAVQCIVRASLFTGQILTGSVVMPLATAACGPLDADTAARLVASPAWESAVSRLAGETAVPKDDGRLIFTATLMPREAVPAFLASLAAVPASAARAANDFADLILALPA